jgi:hypothetical protein
MRGLLVVSINLPSVSPSLLHLAGSVFFPRFNFALGAHDPLGLTGSKLKSTSVRPPHLKAHAEWNKLHNREPAEEIS